MKKAIVLYQSHVRAFISSHIWLSILIAIAIIGCSYWAYSSVGSSATETQYTISAARLGTLTQTVTGTGQVSAQNQLDITSKASGMITSINVSVGQSVKKGDLLATIDSTDALKSLRSAEITYAKLTKPATASDLAQATSSVIKAYDSGFNTAASMFAALPNMVTGMKDLLYSQTGFLSDQQSSYLTSTGHSYRDIAGQKYDKAVVEYDEVLAFFRTLNRNSSRSDIDALLNRSYTVAKDMADAITSTRSAITFILSSQPEYRSDDSSIASTNVNSWLSSINSAISDISSAQTSIQTSVDSLNDLVVGADDLDLQSGKIALEQAQQTYSNYFIRAPFDGTVGKISSSVYGQAGSASLMTLVGDQKISTISLNEIDAAKVRSGQPVSITFDAIDDLTATGTVQSVDLVGTVSSGVVTYNVKIAIDTHDDRIRPGMSLNASIVTEQKENILIVPSSAIKTRNGAKYVETISLASSQKTLRKTTTVSASSASAPTATTVEIGDSDDTNTEIISGLSEGQFVITKTSTGTASSGTKTSSGGVLGNLFSGSRQQTTRTSSSIRSSSTNMPPPGF